MKRLLVCGVAILALSACKSGWSSAQRDDFVKTCTNATAGGMGEAKAKGYCTCMLPKIEKKFPNYNDALKMQSTDPELTEMANDCLK